VRKHQRRWVSLRSTHPTALEGGKLGDLPRGKLFPELDKALFEMKAGEVSGVLESELGFHVLRCDAITEASVLGFAQAKPHIRKLLEQKRKRACQQAWVKQLLKGK
jgi:parvulin-like peptidyl-prolyl isomerase